MLLGLLLAAGMLLLPALRHTPRAGAGSTNVRAAFLYLGPIDTSTWTYAHEQGRLAAAQSLGVDTMAVQAVTAATAPGTLRRMLDQGYNAIFSTSFDFADAVLQVAPQYPNAVFEQATGVTTAANVSTYDGRMYQAWYLAGMAAGATAAANMIGYVAPRPIPEIVRDMNAFTLGARATNPNAQVYPVWINTFFDPAKEREAAETLIAMGVDVVARESDSTLPEQVAAERGIWAVAYNSIPPSDNSPNLLTAPIWHWEVFYKKELADLAAGSWSNAPVWWGVPQGLVDIAPVNEAVPADVRAQIEVKRLGLKIGAADVFAGPLKDNSGAVRVLAGGTLSDAQLLDLDWLVDGVVGALPAP